MNLKLNKKFLLIVAIVSLFLTIAIGVGTTLSIMDIYDCAGPNVTLNDCPALDSANTKVRTGSVLLFISCAVFLITSIGYIWLLMRTRSDMVRKL